MRGTNITTNCVFNSDAQYTGIETQGKESSKSQNPIHDTTGNRMLEAQHKNPQQGTSRKGAIALDGAVA
jgi:hypothetical protein